MAPTDVLECVLAGREEREASQAAAYADMLKEIAKGQEPDPEALDAALAAAGKTADDLRTDVATMVNRLTWAELLASKPGLERQQSEADCERRGLLVSMRKEVEDVQAKYRERLDDAAAREDHAQRTLNGEVRFAERRLRETASRSLFEEGAEVNQRRVEQVQHRDNLVRQARLVREGTEQIREEKVHERDREEWQNTINAREERAAKLESRSREFGKEAERLEEQANKIRAMKLEP